MKITGHTHHALRCSHSHMPTDRMCNCKGSCVRGYCACNRSGELCTDGCGCDETCGNRTNSDLDMIRRSQQMKEWSRVKGCGCKYSKCLKLYCSCMASKVECGIRCRCSGCKNRGQNDDIVLSTSAPSSATSVSTPVVATSQMPANTPSKIHVDIPGCETPLRGKLIDHLTKRARDDLPLARDDLPLARNDLPIGFVIEYKCTASGYNGLSPWIMPMSKLSYSVMDHIDIDAEVRSWSGRCVKSRQVETMPP